MVVDNNYRQHSSSMDLVVYDDEDSTSFYDASYTTTTTTTTNNNNNINHSNHSGGQRGSADRQQRMDQIDEQTYTSNYNDHDHDHDTYTYQSYDERKSAVNTTTSSASSSASQYDYEEETTSYGNNDDNNEPYGRSQSSRSSRRSYNTYSNHSPSNNSPYSAKSRSSSNNNSDKNSTTRYYKHDYSNNYTDTDYTAEQPSSPQTTYSIASASQMEDDVDFRTTATIASPHHSQSHIRKKEDNDTTTTTTTTNRANAVIPYEYDATKRRRNGGNNDNDTDIDMDGYTYDYTREDDYYNNTNHHDDEYYHHDQHHQEEENEQYYDNNFDNNDHPSSAKNNNNNNNRAIPSNTNTTTNNNNYIDDPPQRTNPRYQEPPSDQSFIEHNSETSKYSNRRKSIDPSVIVHGGAAVGSSETTYNHPNDNDDADGATTATALDEISTMSASAITFNTKSSSVLWDTTYDSNKQSKTKRAGRMQGKGVSTNLLQRKDNDHNIDDDGNKSTYTTSSRYRNVLPTHVAFDKKKKKNDKDEEMMKKGGNNGEQVLETVGEEGALVKYSNTNTKRMEQRSQEEQQQHVRRGEQQHAVIMNDIDMSYNDNDNDDYDDTETEVISYNDHEPKKQRHPREKSSSSWKGASGDMMNMSYATIDGKKPNNPPLRNPDRAKSREFMVGRGKTTRSVCGGSSSRRGGPRRRSRSQEARKSSSSSKGLPRDGSGRGRREEGRSRSIPRGSSSRGTQRHFDKEEYDGDVKPSTGGQGRRNTHQSCSRERGTTTRQQHSKNNNNNNKDRHADKRRSRSSESRYRNSRNNSGQQQQYNKNNKSRSRGGTNSHHQHRQTDISMASSTTTTTTDSSVKSSHSKSWRSIRHDIDARGYCLHHPTIRLMKQRINKHNDTSWSTIRKKCPECIREDCPSMMGGDDSTTYYEYGNNDGDGGGGDGEYSLSYNDDYSSSRRGGYRNRNNHHHRHNPNGFDDSAATSTSSSSIATSTSPFDNVLGITSFQTPEEMEEEEATNRLKRRLAARAYHFPGNSWCQDWMQYLSNTHTVLGLFFHHPLHPMGFQERLVILFGSVAIGLTISNFTYLYFIRNGIAVEEEVFTLNSRHTDFTGVPVVSITKLMITLWTLGSFIHTCFDLGLWHMKACTLCRYKGLIDERLVRWGRVVGLFIVMIAMGAGGYAVLLRASIEYKGEGSVADEVEESIMSNELYQIEFEDKRSFRFLLGYLVEFVLALFVYYPLTVTVLFSGVLGCGGRVPILGGRPREMKRESKYERSKRQPKILKGLVNIESEDESTSDIYDNESDYPYDYRDEESRSRFDANEII